MSDTDQRHPRAGAAVVRARTQLAARTALLVRVSHRGFRTSAARPRSCQSRHWMITNTDGEEEEVRGDGRGRRDAGAGARRGFDYNSFCPLKTSVGTMHGSYTMVTPAGDTLRGPHRAVHPRHAVRAELAHPGRTAGEVAAALGPYLDDGPAASGPPSMRRAERVGAAARRRPARDAGQEEDRRPAPPGASPRAGRGSHRRRLAIGLTLMLISRLPGMVLPASAEVRDRRRDRQGPARSAGADRAGGRRRHHRAGGDRLRAVADCSASPRSAPSPTCASACRRRSCACRCATSTRRRPAC